MTPPLAVYTDPSPERLALRIGRRTGASRSDERHAHSDMGIARMQRAVVRRPILRTEEDAPPARDTSTPLAATYPAGKGEGHR